jgi:hypothetical protein
MAKGQMRSNKEARKPKASKPKKVHGGKALGNPQPVKDSR